MLPVSVTKIDHKEILTVENQIYPEGLRVHIAETATMKELPINIILGAEECTKIKVAAISEWERLVSQLLNKLKFEWTKYEQRWRIWAQTHCL